MGGQQSRPGFAGRLLLAQSLVVVGGAVTTWLVAWAVGPSLFHEHLKRADVAHSATETRHVEEAFASALLVSVSVALLAAAAAAIVVSAYFSRRVRRSFAPVAAAAAEIASGRYGTRVPDPGLGGEFSSLTETFNVMAERLGGIEATRRRMLSDLAHEMRTPLATIEAHLDAVEDGVRELDERTLGVVRGSTRRLGRLAEDIAAVSRAEEGSLDVELIPLEVGALARGAAEAAQDRYAAKGVNLHVDAPGRDLVRADPDRLGQVLTNLLDNALRHTPAGGSVRLSCRHVDKWVQLVVADTGEGIGAEHLGHVFDRFYRADTARDRNHGGSGIGLSISRALVEAHGGAIRVTSAGVGRGTTFTVDLPRA